MTGALRRWLAAVAAEGAASWLVGVVAVAATMRVAWCLFAARDPQELHDPLFYVLYGEQLASGNGYRLLDGQPTAYYPVGYPAVLGALFWLADHTPLTGDRPTLVAGLHIVLGVATVVVVFELTRRLTDARIGVVAAALTAVYPNLVFHTAVPLTETLFNLLLLVAVLVLVRVPWPEEGGAAPERGGEDGHAPSCGSPWRRPGWRRLGWQRLAGFGLVLGLSVHVRPVALLGLPFLGMLWWRSAGLRTAAGRLAVVAVAVVAVIVPWTVRNAVVMGAFVPISTNTGDNLCLGRHPGASGGFSLSAYCFGGYDDLQRPEYEIRRNADATEKALDRLRSHWWDEPRMVFWRAFYTFQNDHDGLAAAESYGDDPFIEDRWRPVLETLADAFFFATIGLSVVGLPTLVRRRAAGHLTWRRLALVLTGAGVLSAPLVFFGDVRFHVPLLPFFAIGAAWTIVTARRRLRADALAAEAAAAASASDPGPDAAERTTVGV